eukprot:jgi/Tetstr1/428021/TSEL_000166.t1
MSLGDLGTIKGTILQPYLSAVKSFFQDRGFRNDGARHGLRAMVAGSPWRLVGELESELTCKLCADMFDDPYTVPGCGHAFCRSCIIATLEGPGISSSHCPTCKQPVWKCELARNTKYANLVAAMRGPVQLRRALERREAQPAGNPPTPGPSADSEAEPSASSDRPTPAPCRAAGPAGAQGQAGLRGAPWPPPCGSPPQAGGAADLGSQGQHPGGGVAPGPPMRSSPPAHRGQERSSLDVAGPSGAAQPGYGPVMDLPAPTGASLGASAAPLKYTAWGQPYATLVLESSGAEVRGGERAAGGGVGAPGRLVWLPGAAQRASDGSASCSPISSCAVGCLPVEAISDTDAEADAGVEFVPDSQPADAGLWGCDVEMPCRDAAGCSPIGSPPLAKRRRRLSPQTQLPKPSAVQLHLISVSVGTNEPRAT